MELHKFQVSTFIGQNKQSVLPLTTERELWREGIRVNITGVRKSASNVKSRVHEYSVYTHDEFIQIV